MQFEKYVKGDNLNNYDVFPLVMNAGEETQIHIRPLGGRREFEPGRIYTLTICALDTGFPRDYPVQASFEESDIVCNEEGGFTVKHTFPTEQMYFLRFSTEGRKINQFPVYAVDGDLRNMYPFTGDLHMHTNLSDGHEIPEVVAANYRRHGYDFFAITDHGRYYPSLRAIEYYKNTAMEFVIVPGEEVHLPDVHGRSNDVHIVNFGGEFSVNALVEGAHTEEAGRDLSKRAIRENDVPDIMTREEYADKMEALVAAANIPAHLDPVPPVVCKWIFDTIRSANGLGIFAHPNWISDVYQVPEALTDYMFETRPFDAFEVLGGESYYEHNGTQTARYYEECAKGHKVPIVGSTDSHCSYSSNRNAFICSTMVFAPVCERTEIISAIKNYRSVAIDTISEEFRIVGDRRLQKYACFLLKNFFPLHDELASEEGRLMKEYATGTPEEKQEALRVMAAISGRMRRQREKYFAFGKD